MPTLPSRLAIWLLLLALAPGVVEAARPPAAVELRGRGGALGQLSLVAVDDGSYIAAERLAALLKGAWVAKGKQATLTVGSRVARFTQNQARVVLAGAAVTLSSPARLGASGWLIPEDFLAKGLAKLAPGVSVTKVAARERVPRETTARDASPHEAMPRGAAPRDPATREAGTRDTPVKDASAAVASALPARETGAAAAVGSLPKPGKEASGVAMPAPAAKPAKGETGFQDLRLRSYPSFTRIVIESGAALTYVVEPGATEVTVRLRGFKLSGPQGQEIADGLVSEVKLEPADGEAVLRVTLDGTAGEVKDFSLQDPFRVVLDIYRPKEPAVTESPRGGGGTIKQPLQVVVLDAGHGGHDPGATGPTGLTEKEVVLDVTKRVARMIEENRLGIKVALTRSTDVFVPLRDRTNFANKQRADLFVSIHANAHPRSTSEGVETYFLSSEATDNEARQVAALENGVVQLESPGSRQKTGVLKSILWDLAQSEFQQESSFLAETVQDSMTRSLQLVNRGVKQAGFYVLGGAAMPAILVEIGFMTNPKEEKKLSSAEYRESVARAILAGLTEYKRRYDQRMRTADAAPAPTSGKTAASFKR